MALTIVGTAHAGLDDELTLVDGKGRPLRIRQWDTFLNGVFPLDRNRLRPFARLIGGTGDGVTTCGETWDMRLSLSLDGCADAGHRTILDAMHSNGRRAAKQLCICCELASQKHSGNSQR